MIAIGRTIFAAENPARDCFIAEKVCGGNAFNRGDTHSDEGGFLEHAISDVQLLLAAPGNRRAQYLPGL